MKKKNSKGQIIEELDPPFPPLEKVEPNHPPLGKVEPNPPLVKVQALQNCLVGLAPHPPLLPSRRLLQKVEQNCMEGLALRSAEPFPKVEGLAPPFPKVEKVEDKEILDWCERYLAAKKNNLYNLYDLYKFYKS